MISPEGQGMITHGGERTGIEGAMEALNLNDKQQADLNKEMIW